MTLLAITVRPPWSHAIMHLGKSIENRHGLARWQRAAGQRIAIHAGLRWTQTGADHIEHLTGRHLTDCDVDLGAIIGTVLVAEVHIADDCCDPWGDEQRRSGESRDPLVHLELANPRPCDPIGCRGALGLWRVPEQVEREIEAVRR